MSLSLALLKTVEFPTPVTWAHSALQCTQNPLQIRLPLTYILTSQSQRGDGSNHVANPTNTLATILLRLCNSQRIGQIYCNTSFDSYLSSLSERTSRHQISRILEAARLWVYICRIALIFYRRLGSTAACEISKRSDNSQLICRDCEILRDLSVRHLTTSWMVPGSWLAYKLVAVVYSRFRKYHNRPISQIP